MPGVARGLFATLDRYDAEAREYTAHYQVEDVAATETGTAIILASGFPALGSSYVFGGDFDTYAVAVGYSNFAPVTGDAHGGVWRAQVKYSTDPNKQRRPAANQDNPINKPAVISGGAHRRRAAAHEIREKDQLGVVVLNKANFQFPDKEVEIDHSSQIIRITKNYASIDLDLLEDYSDSVNSTAWMGKAPRTWKMDPPTWRKVYWGNTAYYEISYAFQGNSETWDLKPRHLSRIDKNGKLKEVEGVMVNDWFGLDADGEWLAAFEPLISYDGVGGNPDPFRWYKERDFTSLGLPSSP